MQVRGGSEGGLSTTFVGKAGSPGIGDPDLHGSQPGSTQGIPAFLNALRHGYRHDVLHFVTCNICGRYKQGFGVIPRFLVLAGISVDAFDRVNLTLKR